MANSPFPQSIFLAAAATIGGEVKKYENVKWSILENAITFPFPKQLKLPRRMRLRSFHTATRPARQSSVCRHPLPHQYPKCLIESTAGITIRGKINSEERRRHVRAIGESCPGNTVWSSEISSKTPIYARHATTNELKKLTKSFALDICTPSVGVVVSINSSRMIGSNQRKTWRTSSYRR